VDNLRPEVRRAVMSRIRSVDTRPELLVRSVLHRAGYRFRVHRRDLPGTPDLVFPARRKVVFVHGCFWHGHTGCARAVMPKSHQDYWWPKIVRTQSRDKEATDSLRLLGWDVYVIWECETRCTMKLLERLVCFLERPGQMQRTTEGLVLGESRWLQAVRRPRLPRVYRQSGRARVHSSAPIS